MIKNKKGQPSGGTAATLIGIITLLLIFYILFLPPAERAELLGEDIDEETGEIGAPGVGEIIMQVPIGRLDVVPQREMEHYIPNIYLQEYKSAKILATINPFTIRKTLTQSEKKNFTFGISNIEHAENIMLSFSAPKHKGTLKITLNGYEIYEGDVSQLNPKPIPMRKSQLRQSNTLVFELTGIGIPTKEYSFTDAKIIADLTDPSRMSSKSTVAFKDFEYNNLERAWLDYFPTCDQLSIGTLTISFNGKTLFSGVPSCDSPARQDIFQEDIRPGKNTIEIKVSKGNIGIEQMKLKTILKPTRGFSDFFTIENALYEDVRSGQEDIVLVMEFIDDGKTKRAQVNINGRLDVIDQRKPRFVREISNVIIEGNNYIEVMPLTDINIVRLEIRAE